SQRRVRTAGLTPPPPDKPPRCSRAASLHRRTFYPRISIIQFSLYPIDAVAHVVQTVARLTYLIKQSLDSRWCHQLIVAPHPCPVSHKPRLQSTCRYCHFTVVALALVPFCFSNTGCVSAEAQ
ncbi:unnamed protein product, partial [Sphacelaria rigidula]